MKRSLRVASTSKASVGESYYESVFSPSKESFDESGDEQVASTSKASIVESTADTGSTEIVVSSVRPYPISQPL
jgi:hypothetical protein